MFDHRDVKILALLQENARITASEVAKAVNLSVPAAGERMKKLVDSGFVKRFAAILDAKQAGLDLTAFIFVVSASSDHYEDFVKKAQESPFVLECHSITGEGSHLLKVRVANSTALEKILRAIQAWPGVTRTHTDLVLSTYKEEVSIDLGSLAAKYQSK